MTETANPPKIMHYLYWANLPIYAAMLPSGTSLEDVQSKATLELGVCPGVLCTSPDDTPDDMCRRIRNAELRTYDANGHIITTELPQLTAGEYSRQIAAASEAFAAVVIAFCDNHGSRTHATAVSQLLRRHRTSQQSVMRFFLQFVAGMAIAGTDDRNEASVELAKAIMAIDPEKRVLPLI